MLGWHSNEDAVYIFFFLPSSVVTFLLIKRDYLSESKQHQRENEDFLKTNLYPANWEERPKAVANSYLDKLSQDLLALYSNMGGSLQAKKPGQCLTSAYVLVL